MSGLGHVWGVEVKIGAVTVWGVEVMIDAVIVGELRLLIGTDGLDIFKR